MGLLALKHTITKGEKLRELDLLHATYTQLCFLVCTDNLSLLGQKRTQKGMGNWSIQLIRLAQLNAAYT